MTFDPAWEKGYRERSVGVGMNAQINDLANSFCDGQQDRVLELGCGLGFNVDYWLKRHSDYYAIEGSALAVEACHAIWPYLRERIVCADFTLSLPFGGNFDVVFDRAAIPHNNLADIKRTIAHVYEALKPGGIFLSCDWFSDNSSFLKDGVQIDDEYTRTGYTDGTFRNAGRVHFSTRDEIAEIFTDFTGILVQERLIRQESAGRETAWAVWDLVMRKPK